MENKLLENKSGRKFCVRQVYKFLPINLGACKPIFYFFYTPHLRRKSTMRRCFYHTDLVQNAVVHNFSRQIAFIHYWRYSGPSKHAWTFSETAPKNFQNHLYGQPVLIFDKRQICKEISKELRFNMIKDWSCLFFVNCLITMCKLKKRLIRAAFRLLLQAMSTKDWKQTAKGWKLHFWDH